MYLHKTPRLLQWLYSGLVWHGSRHDPVVFLTFDDGPVPEYTEFILNTLKEYKAAGTFFCVGDNIRKYPAIFQKILDEGHRVGNHTMHHMNGWKTETSDYMRDVHECQKELMRFGQESKLFRPPYGRMKRSQMKKLRDYRIIMWDVLSGDFDIQLSPSACLENTYKCIKNGSILVFHDNEKARDRLFYVLPRLLKRLQTNGYSFGHL
jgi:peptidoglycan-N-acetylglucosamine deacetylase